MQATYATGTIYQSGSTETSFSVTMPSGLKPGDLLTFFIFANHGSADQPTPTGWTKRRGPDTNGTATTSWFYRYADGTEGASLSYTSATSSIWTASLSRITGAIINDGPTAAGFVGSAATPYTATTLTASQYGLAVLMEANNSSSGSTVPAAPGDMATQLTVGSSVNKQGGIVCTKSMPSGGATGSESVTCTNGTVGSLYFACFRGQDDSVFFWKTAAWRRRERRYRRAPNRRALHAFFTSTSSPSDPGPMGQKRRRHQQPATGRVMRPKLTKYKSGPGILPGAVKALLGRAVIVESRGATALVKEALAATALSTEAMSASAADVQSTLPTP